MLGLLAAALVVAGTACTASSAETSESGPGVGRAGAPVDGPAVTVTTEAPTTTTTEAPTTTTTAPPPPKPMDDGKLEPGEKGPEVALLQMRLAELGYRPGTLDGEYGPSVSSAVLAFQKREGLGRDGIAGPEVLERLPAPQGAGPRDPSPGTRIEVDLTRQVAFVMLPDGSVTTLNISSGNNETYAVPGTNETAVAYTPTGTYRVGLRIDGPEDGKLGRLWKPLYFTGGWAVHGSTSVPAYPASHGCVRTSYEDQDWLFPQIPSGTPVTVYYGAETAAPAAPEAPANAAPGE